MSPAKGMRKDITECQSEETLGLKYKYHNLTTESWICQDPSLHYMWQATILAYFSVL